MKKTLSTITLAATIAFGATFANAGIIIGDRASDCTQKDGIIIGDSFISNVINAIEGIIIGDAPKSDPCTTQTDGIIIGD
jgi:hypothetical protein